MTTSTSKLHMMNEFHSMSSREIGNLALDRILQELQSSDVLELDFGGRLLTPSFADQCLGGLAARLGLDEFKRRVKIKNATAESASLIKHVVISRAIAAK